MDRLKKYEKNNIEKILKENFNRLMPTFYEMESSFLSGVYKRYGDLEGGNIVIYFANSFTECWSHVPITKSFGFFC